MEQDPTEVTSQEEASKLIVKANEYRSSKQFEEAKECFLKAIELDPNNVHSYTGIAHMFLNKNQAEEGISYLRRAIEINPNHAEIYNSLGLALKTSKQNEEAI